jgi:transcriptional regulator with XRE-family HTH domain
MTMGFKRTLPVPEYPRYTGEDSVAERVKFLRKEVLKVTQQVFGAMCDKASKQTVWQWERGPNTPDITQLWKLESATGANPAWINDGEGDILRFQPNDAMTFSGKHLVPVYDEYEPDDKPSGQVVCPVTISEQGFATFYTDELSMTPEFKKGDIVFVDPGVTPKSGDLVLICRREESGAPQFCTVREYVRDANLEFLRIINPAFPTGQITERDKERDIIVGTILFQGRIHRDS